MSHKYISPLLSMTSSAISLMIHSLILHCKVQTILKKLSWYLIHNQVFTRSKYQMMINIKNPILMTS